MVPNLNSRERKLEKKDTVIGTWTNCIRTNEFKIKTLETQEGLEKRSRPAVMRAQSLSLKST